MSDRLLPFLISGVAALYQAGSGQGVPALTQSELADSIRGLVASGDVDLMAAYEKAVSVAQGVGDYSVGCVESSKSNGADDRKKAFLVAVGNLSKRRDLAISGKEVLDGSVLYSEATERSVFKLGPVRETESMVFAAPKGTIACVLIREGINK